MNSLIWQLRVWQFRERLVRLAWGGARWFAIVAIILAFACLADWLYDRRADVPLALRVLAAGVQAAIAAALAYLFLIRPWAKTPGIDDLAFHAEQRIAEFDHRLVTALQLNRRGARTQGMSPALIAEVTREAGEMASRHRLARLIDYSPLLRAAVVAIPVILAWGGFTIARPDLAVVLLKRQMLLNVDIPRSVSLENITAEVWPSGSEVMIRYRVAGEWIEAMTGRVFVRPDNQPEDEYTLTFAGSAADGTARFACKLPPSSTGFAFTARLSDGRTRSVGRVDFEPPPQTTEIKASQLLPTYLGMRPDGSSYERTDQSGERGEIVNALPLSGIHIAARFNKPVVRAVLTLIERGDGNKEINGMHFDTSSAPLSAVVGMAALPGALTGNSELSSDSLSAEWVFPTSARAIGYRIELADRRGFTQPVPIRRGIRMMPDEPPAVEFRRESSRNPDPLAFDGKDDPHIYEWDYPVAFVPNSNPAEGDTGPIQVIYSAQSELGIGRVNLVYRIIPRGAEAENIHPRDDPDGRVFSRLPMTRTVADPAKVGNWVPDLGLFEKSWAGFGQYDPRRRTAQVEFYPVPSADPLKSPGELDAGGRYIFQTGGLRKKSADSVLAKLEIGDTIEIYMEVYDKYSTFLEGKKLAGPIRPAGYTGEAKRKTIMSEEDAYVLTKQRDEAQKKLQDKLRTIADDQRNVFQPKK